MASKRIRSLGVAACLMMGLLVVMASGALAATLNVCVPEKEGADLKTPKAGKCAAKFKESRLLPQAEAEELEKIKQAMTYVASGVGGKTTIRISGANLQIVSGGGKTAESNGAGNLVIGYDENPNKHQQTGSNDLVLGEEQTFTSYGSILGGTDNTASGPFASVSGGVQNTASGEFATAGGGYLNTASGEDSWVAGFHDTASGGFASVSGGSENVASGEESSVSGGYSNSATGGNASVSGGVYNSAVANAAVSGGSSNSATQEYASISGGQYNSAEGLWGSVSGGEANRASGEYASVSGGYGNVAERYAYASVSGGLSSVASGYGASVGGGYGNTADGSYASISGGEYDIAEGGWSWLGAGYKNLVQEQASYGSVYGGKELTVGKAYEAKG
jgi:trimeric autotransporter adhesin